MFRISTIIQSNVTKVVSFSILSGIWFVFYLQDSTAINFLISPVLLVSASVIFHSLYICGVFFSQSSNSKKNSTPHHYFFKIYPEICKIIGFGGIWFVLALLEFSNQKSITPSITVILCLIALFVGGKIYISLKTVDSILQIVYCLFNGLIFSLMALFVIQSKVDTVYRIPIVFFFTMIHFFILQYYIVDSIIRITGRSPRKAFYKIFGRFVKQETDFGLGQVVPKPKDTNELNKKTPKPKTNEQNTLSLSDLKVRVK